MNKQFKDLSQDEINALTKEEFDAVSPYEKRSCFDCKHLKGIISLWCTQENAIKTRGTRIPGCIKCTFWEPNLKYIDSDKFPEPKIENI